MTVVLVSPERDHSHEHVVLAELFAAGLERLHVRKPHATATDLEAYLRRIPDEFRSRVVLHQHHELVEKLNLGGLHWRDAGLHVANTARPDASPYLRSRSCHDLTTLRASLGEFDAVFFGPVFSSISKPGYQPTILPEAISELLHARQGRGGCPGRHATAWLSGRRPLPTEVIAIGGIDRATAPQALAMGFDGVAVLGAVWQATDPLAAFRDIASSLGAAGDRNDVCKTDALQETI